MSSPIYVLDTILKKRGDTSHTQAVIYANNVEQIVCVLQKGLTKILTLTYILRFILMVSLYTS